MLALQNLLMATRHRAASIFITFGLGATNLNVENVTNTAMTLNINVGDCVICFGSCSSSGISTGCTDNGASGGNTYTALGSIDVGGDLMFGYICLSATKTATSITVAHCYNHAGCTLLNVGSVGASQFTQTGDTLGGPQSASLTTTGTNSMLFGYVMETQSGSVFTAVTGTILESASNGLPSAFLNYQASA